MRFQIVASVLVASLCAVGSASYELGLIMQGNKITRWDPVTNMNLGSFNLLIGGASMISYQSTGEAYVLSGTNVYRYDYSTGEYRGRYDVGAGATTLSKGMNDGELLVGYSNAVRRRNVTTGAQIGVDLAWSGTGFSYSQGALAMRSTGVYYLLSEATTYFDGMDYLIGVNAASSWVGNFQNAGSAGSTTTTIRNGDVQGNLVGFITSPNSNTTAYYDFARRVSSDTLTYVYDNAGHGASRPVYMQFGHAESLVSIVGTPTQYYYVRSPYDGSFGATQTLISGLDGTANVTGFSMIVAPEPSSLAALGLAGLLLLRRRERA